MFSSGNVNSDGKHTLRTVNYLTLSLTQFTPVRTSMYQIPESTKSLRHFHIYVTISACCKCVVGGMYLSFHIINDRYFSLPHLKEVPCLSAVQYNCFKITVPFSLNGTPSNRWVSLVPKSNVPLYLSPPARVFLRAFFTWHSAATPTQSRECVHNLTCTVGLSHKHP